MAAGGKWETSGNWSSGAPSTAYPAEYIANAGTKTVTIDATTAGSFPGTMLINNLIIGSPGGTDINTLSLDHPGATPLHVLNDLHLLAGGALLADTSSLLVDGGSTFTVDGTASLTDSSLSAAKVKIALAGPGSLTLNGGTAQIGQLWIGYGDAGVLANNGANLIVSNLVLGGLPGSDGTLVMQGGSLSSTSNGLVLSIGQQGAGTFVLNWGAVTATSVLLTNGASSVLQLTGGVLNSSSVVIGPGAMLLGSGTVGGSVLTRATS